jgi:hypothetical protein
MHDTAGYYARKKRIRHKIHFEDPFNPLQFPHSSLRSGHLIADLTLRVQFYQYICTFPSAQNVQILIVITSSLYILYMENII